MTDINLSFNESIDGNDGYSIPKKLGGVSYIYVQVGPDDTATWSLQGTVKEHPNKDFHSEDWYNLVSSGGESVSDGNGPIQSFDVDKYWKFRVYVSDTDLLTKLYLKTLSGI